MSLCKLSQQLSESISRIRMKPHQLYIEIIFNWYPAELGQHQEHIEILMIFKKRQNKSLDGEARQEL